MEHQLIANAESRDVIDMGAIFSTIWKSKILVGVTTLIFSITGIAYSLSTPNIYKSSVLLAPAKEKRGDLASIAGQFGGLASLAGINIGTGDTDQIVIAKETLESRKFIAEFIKRHEIASIIYAATSWDEEKKEWNFDPELYDVETQKWKFDDEGETFKPSDWDLVKDFKEDHFRVSEDKNTGLITISIKSYSPIEAKMWAEWIVNDINEYIREKDVKEAERSIKYLEEKLEETTISGMQKIFYQLIEAETRTVMLANAREEYIFKTIDPAVVPEEKAEPKRAIICLIAAFLGFLIGIVIALIKNLIQRNKTIPENIQCN